MPSGARTSSPPAKTRVIKYEHDGDYDGDAVEKLLRKALRETVITQFHSGSSTDQGIFIWYEGPPGRAIRQLRKEVAAQERRRSRS